jgi:hypothetical protein
MLAKIFIENSDKPNMTPLITYRTLSPEPLVNAPNLPLNFDLTKLQSAILDTRVNQELKFNGINYFYQDNQLHFELFFIFICILITNKQIKLRFSDVHLNIYKKSFNTIIFGLKQNIIIELGASSCQIGYEEVKALANALETNITLNKISLSDNNFGDDGAIVLANALNQNTTLLELDIYANQIGDKGTIEIAKALEINKTLKSITLNFNNIGDSGATALASALSQNKTLDFLYLNNNKIGIEGTRKLITALEINTTLNFISLRSLEITNEEYSILIKLLIEKDKTKKFGHRISIS